MHFWRSIHQECFLISKTPIPFKSDEVSFFYCGDDISVEKRVPTTVKKEIDIATTVKEMDVKVSALPSDEEITVEVKGTQLQLKWGRKSTIKVNTVKESIPPLEIPEVKRKVNWPAGSLHGLTKIMTPYTALRSSERGLARPSVCGPNTVRTVV